MFWIITTILLVIITLLATAYLKAEGGPAKTALSTGLAVIIVFTLAMSFTSVKPRSVGIATAFGKPVATYPNGLHAKAPWWSVTDMDGSIQNNIYNGENQVAVRLANNSQAKVDASVQWQLKEDETLNLFLNYRSIETIQSNVIDRNLKSAINEAMATYDPLNAENPAEGGKDLASFEKTVAEKLREKVNGQVEVISVTLPIISFDEATQNRINELQSETAKTRIAEQSKQTAEQEAEANKKLEQSITQETLTSKCLDIVKEKGGSVYGCFPSDVTPVKKVD